MLTLPPLFLVFPPWHGWKNKNSSPLPLIHCSPTKSLGNVSLDRSSPTTTRVSTKYFSIIFLFSPLKAINQNLSMKFDRPPSSMRFDEWASKLNYVYFWSFFLFLIKRRINYTIDRFNVKVRARIKSSKLKYRFFLQKKSKSADRDRAASHEIARIHNLKQPVGYDKRTVLVRKGRNFHRRRRRDVFKKRHEFSNASWRGGEHSLSFVVFHHLHTGCRFQSPCRGKQGPQAGVTRRFHSPWRGALERTTVHASPRLPRKSSCLLGALRKHWLPLPRVTNMPGHVLEKEHRSNHRWVENRSVLSRTCDNI